MRFELEEIEAAAPDPGERGELGAERERLRHAEALERRGGRCACRCRGERRRRWRARSRARARRRPRWPPSAGVDERLDALAERVSAAAVELSDLASELRSYADGVEAEPGRLEAVEERLEAVERLERKHGGTIEAVLAHAERCRAEIERLAGAAELAEALEARLAAARDARAELAKALTKSRRRAAPKLEKAVAEALAGLAMDGARLEVVLEPAEAGFAASGAESVELRVATNPGMPVSPLRDAASGGELSRIMLALSGSAVAAAV